MQGKCLKKFYSQFTADVVEWNHVDTSQCILATYFLNKDETRSGSLEGFQIKNVSVDSESHEMDLERTFCLPVDFGIFDVKFNHQNQFLAAGSGKTVLYASPVKKETGVSEQIAKSNESRVESSGAWENPAQIASFILDEPTVMCTSTDFNNKKHNIDPIAFVSMSSGEIAILDLGRGSSSKIEAISQWSGHDLEAWIVACNHFEPDIFYSGGDDAMFKGWDQRMGEFPIFRVKTHKAGVCSIQKHPHDEYKLATGSYDSNVYLWDTRTMGRPLDIYDTGGGVWRTKWNPFKPDMLMLACMRTSFQFLRVVNDKFEFVYNAEIEDGENLAYGCDWCYEDAQSDSFHFASCSFYNKELQWWSIKADGAK